MLVLLPTRALPLLLPTAPAAAPPPAAAAWGRGACGGPQPQGRPVSAAVEWGRGKEHQQSII